MSGLAIATLTGGAVFLLAGLRNATLADTARALVKGQKIPSQGSDLDTARITTRQQAGMDQDLSAGPGGTPEGTRVAAAAESYVGQVDYVWAGEDPIHGWDCSGFVTWVLHHDMGIELPDNVHTTAAGFLVWGGARTIPRAQCAAGDLVCWASHIGIAISNTEMANASRPGTKTEIDKIWSVPAPTIRRPIVYGLPPTVGVGGRP